MKILFVSHYFTPEGNAPARRVHRFCKEWVKAGHEVTVLTGTPNVPDGVPYPGYRNEWRQEENIDGIRVIRIWTYLAPNKGTGKRIINYLSFMKIAVLQGIFLPRYDVIIATSPQFFCGWAGRILAWLKRTPFVLEIRDLWPASIQAVGALRNPVLLHVLETLERWLYAGSPTIVTVGEGYRADLISRQVPVSHIHVIPNSIDPAVTPPGNTDELRRSLGIAPSSFVCAYVGTIGMACGLDVVLDAVRTLNSRTDAPVTFLLVGDGASREHLQQKALKEGLKGIIFTGLVPHDKVPDYLALADVCLIHLIQSPVFESVIPTKLLDAAAFSKPVILGVKGVAEKMVSTGESGICIPPQDPIALMKAIQTLQSNPELRHRMGRNGHEHLMATHNLTTLAGNYLKLIEGIVPSQ